MKQRRVVRGFIGTGVVVAVALAAVLLTASTLAPTTQGLILQTVSSPEAAASGNRNEAALFVSVYNEAGSVRGLPGGSFSVAVLTAPTGAAPIVKSGVTESVSGIYRIGLTPELSAHRWSSGTYILGVTLTSANGSGIALAELVIER